MQEIFRLTPHDKQVMMFSATLSKEIRPVCKKFMQDVIFSLCGDSLTSYEAHVPLFYLLLCCCCGHITIIIAPSLLNVLDIIVVEAFLLAGIPSGSIIL